MVKKLLKKKFLNKFNLPFVIIYCLIILASYFISGFFLFEWVISFMPYLILLNLILLISLLKKRRIYVAVFLLIVTVIFTFRFIDFSFVKPQEGKGSIPLTITFFNKHYLNKEYGEIEKAVKKIDPQILGIAEMDSKDEGKMKFLQSFQYRKIITSKDKFTTGIYSKYPMEFLDLNKKELPHVIGANTMIENKSYYVFIIHTNNSLNPSSNTDRDKELETLISYINKLPTQDNILLMGDLNLTQWSPVYRRIFDKNGILVDTAKGRGIITSWGPPILRSQIDHIFVTKNVRVDSLKTEFVKGSDHYLIWSIIRI